MKRSKNCFISKAGKAIAGFAVVCSVFAPLGVSTGYAAEASAAGAASNASLRIGDSHAGGKVAYIFRHGDRGYVAGQVHGLIAGNEDLPSSHWNEAIKSCKEYRGGGFEDWRLPSKDELDKLYINRIAIGGFKERNYYWSGTESDLNDAWDQSFRTGSHNLGYKLDNNRIRPVRTF